MKEKKRKYKTSKTKKGKRMQNENKDIKPKKKDTKMKFKYKHPKLAIAIKIILIVLAILCVIGAGVIIGLLFGNWGELFSIEMEELALKANSQILDSEGNVIAELTGDENRKIITLEQMTTYLPKAYVAIEDERFEKHHGVDLKTTAKAAISFVINGGKSTAGGGSTITQQVVKNVTQDKDTRGIKGVLRKVKEWVKAYQIEEVLSKDQILELYLNLIYIGGNKDNRGVEIASEYYFNKTAKDLSIAQCAFLAGINHSPNRYNPYSSTDVTERISSRTKTVLYKMKELTYITPEEYDTAVAEVEAGFKFENGAKGNVYSSHTDALITQIINQIMEEKQISKDAATTYLYSSGLKIYSTQVSSIQTVMEEEAKDNFYVIKSIEDSKNEDGTLVTAQGAMVVLEPSTGKVVGCIGQIGEKNTSRGQNRATQSLRSPGSTFKPLADILPGIEEGIITPATKYADNKTIFNEGKINEYKPENYNKFTGIRTVRSAVTTSQNIPFIKVLAELGTEKSIEYLKKMGISTLDENRDTGLPLAIGGLTYGVSPLEMAAAYAAIANNGNYIEPIFYTKVEDLDGKIVLEPTQKTEKVCSEDTAYMLKDLLVSVVKDSGATASYCAISGIDVAAKTGTSNDDKDRWLCGFTNYYAGAAWIGFDDPEEVYVGNKRNPAGQLFSQVMKAIHKGLPGSTFQKTTNIITATVCSDTGLLATNKCSNKYSEIFIKGKLPDSCDGHTGNYTICTASGKLANEYCPDSTRQDKSLNYVLEKERLGLWNTPEINTVVGSKPKEYCTLHKKVEVIEPEITDEPEEPDDSNTSTTTKPDDANKPSESGGNNTTKPETGEGTGNTSAQQNKPQT